eukprot:2252066-Rhodomonas_salina.1
MIMILLVLVLRKPIRHASRWQQLPVGIPTRVRRSTLALSVTTLPRNHATQSLGHTERLAHVTGRRLGRQSRAGQS